MSRKLLNRDALVLVVIFGSALAAFGACKLDDKNPALGNEAPNRSLPNISIGNGGPGSGGSGAGLGSGGSTTSTTVIPPNCDCAFSFAGDGQCQSCFASSCTQEETDCDGELACTQSVTALQGCTDAQCVEDVLNAGGLKFQALLSCGCLECGPTNLDECTLPAFTCQ